MNAYVKIVVIFISFYFICIFNQFSVIEILHSITEIQTKIIYEALRALNLQVLIKYFLTVVYVYDTL